MLKNWTKSRRDFLLSSMAIAVTATMGRNVMALGKNTWPRNALSEEMDRYIDGKEIPGIVTMLDRRGETHVGVQGRMDFGAAPLARDSIFRIASMTKPITAALAMMMVEGGLFRLDDPVDRWLPELADRRVLRQLDGPLDDTVPASRPILVSDLLTLRMGLGAILAPGDYPIQNEMHRLGVGPGPWLPDVNSPDDWIAALAPLPLMHQPGEAWMYDTGLTVMGVLLSRATGQPLRELMLERVFEPLGMVDTDFYVPTDKLDRLTACYWRNYQTGEFEIFDPAGRESRFAKMPGMPSAAGGLVSTADDYLAFARMMVNGGEHAGNTLLSRTSLKAMTTDHITPEQKARSPFGPGFWEQFGWGYGLSVVKQAKPDGPQGYGWMGGYGTTGYWDPESGLIGILLTQRLMESPSGPPVFLDFWRHANQAVDG